MSLAARAVDALIKSLVGCLEYKRRRTGETMSKRTLSYGGVFVATIAVGFGVMSYRSGSQEIGTPLEIAPSKLSFGEAWARDGYQWSLPICNRGERIVRVLDVRTSCSCAGTVDPRSFVLRPGETKVVQLTLDLTSSVKEKGTQGKYPLSFDVVVVSDAGKRLRQTWQIEGVVRHAVECSPSRIDFFGDLVEGANFPARRVHVRCFDSASNLEVECDPDLVRVVVHPADGEGREFELEVTPAEGQPVGSFEDTIVVRPILKMNDEPPPAKLQVLGTVLPDVRAIPGAILLGPVAVGHTVVRDVRIGSRLGRALRLDKAESGCDALDVRAAAGSDQSVCGITVRVTARTTGAREASITADVVDENGSTSRVSIPVSWYGTGNGGPAG